MNFILASASPRRLALLEQAGLKPFAIVPADIDEKPHKGELPQDYVKRMAHEKANAVHALHPQQLVLAADTTVACGRRILGKPQDEKDARRFLELLSGRRHRVYTAVTLICPETGASPPLGGGRLSANPKDAARSGRGLPPTPQLARSFPARSALCATARSQAPGFGCSPPRGELTRLVMTQVQFKRLHDKEIDWYVASGEWQGLAGGYAIQGLAARFITRINGSYSNVVGLPLCEIYIALSCCKMSTY